MKTIRETKVDNLRLRLVEKNGVFVGLIFANGALKAKTEIEGASADDVWRRLHDAAGRANPKYFGFDGARARFLRYFPSGFHSADYVEKERDYKLAAKSKLDAAVPLEKAATGTGFGEAILSIFRATNLLSPFEKVRLQDVLRGEACDDFIRGCQFYYGRRNACASRDGARP